MKSWTHKLVLASAFLAVATTSSVAHATKIMDRDAFEYNPSASYYRSAFYSRLSVRDAMEITIPETRGIEIDPVALVQETLTNPGDTLFSLTDATPLVGSGITGVEQPENRGIPEPGTLALLLIGLVSLGMVRRYGR